MGTSRSHLIHSPNTIDWERRERKWLHMATILIDQKLLFLKTRKEDSLVVFSHVFKAKVFTIQGLFLLMTV